MLYTATYNSGNFVNVDGVECPILLPDMPPVATMINYGRPIHEQKFEKIVVPDNLKGSDIEEKFVSDEWHKRRNGLWIFIGGEPVYVPGQAYFFFNYWYAEYGSTPDFRMEAVWFYQIMNFVEKNPNYFGLLDFKARRIGDSEKALCYGYELCTRYRKSHFGMMNKNDVDAKKNFDRVTEAHEKMVYFFKPESKGKDRPESILELRFPQKEGGFHTTKKELGSKVTFQPTKKAAYDGERLRFFHGDEPGKVPVSKMNYVDQWGIVKQCISLNMGKLIVGKAILSTTIEDMDNGSLVLKMQELWDGSDPNDLNENGRTRTGMLRVFRGYHLAAPIDEFGRPKLDEVARDRAIEIRAMELAGDLEGITAFKRKFPSCIEDSLAIPAEDCTLYPGKLDYQMARIEELKTLPTYPQKPVRGNFNWTAGFGSQVKWTPDPNGLWYVSGHPKDPNKKGVIGGIFSPGNHELFAAGADPVDAYRPNGGGSKGSLVIEALPNLYDEPVESDAWSENPKRELMLWGRTVCTYTNRPENPYLYYEHCLMTAMYYGCQVLIEKPKVGLINYMIQKGMYKYLAVRPGTPPQKVLEPNDYGCSATPETIMMYERELRTYISENYMKMYHAEVLADARQYNGKKESRTKRDLTVAWGWARLQASIIQQRLVLAERNSRSSQNQHKNQLKRYNVR